jgi:hypothetical protein
LIIKLIKYWNKLFVLVFILVLSACSVANRPPSVLNHRPPDFSIIPFPFEQAGCTEVNDQIDCPTDSPLSNFGCDSFSTPGDYLGGLDPAYPITICWKSGFGGQSLSQDQYIYRDGCSLPQYARYVISKDGQYLMLSSIEDMQKTYAPITSADEALSYALATTGLSAYFGFEAPRGFRYFVNQLEDSHVVESDQGYLVYLYDYQLCGCGPHTFSYVEVLINPNGNVQETGRIPVYEDPEQDTLCVD